MCLYLLKGQSISKATLESVFLYLGKQVPPILAEIVNLDSVVCEECYAQAEHVTGDLSMCSEGVNRKITEI